MQARIVYASMTGNTEQCMDIVEEALESLDVDVIVEESSFADPFDFEEDDICIVGTYTWGPDGNLPDEIIDFYEELEEVDLDGKVFGVFGSGDTFYEGKFCQSAVDFDNQFEKTGAARGAECVKVKLDPEEDDISQLEQFAQALYEAARS